MLRWIYGPLLTRQADNEQNHWIVPLTTSIDNLESVAVYLEREAGPCTITTSSRNYVNQMVFDNVRDAFQVEEHDREAMNFEWRTPDEQRVMLGVMRDQPASFWAAPDYTSAMREAALLLTRDAQYGISAARFARALKVASWAAALILIAVAWALNHDRTWPITLLASFGGLACAAWLARQAEAAWIGTDRGLRRDRMIVHEKSRREIVESLEVLQARRKDRLFTVMITVPATAILTVIGTYFAWHQK